MSRLRAALTAALAGRGARALLDREVGGSPRWTRANHRGEPVSLLEGPATAAGLLVGAMAVGGRAGIAGAAAAAGGGVFGVIDDVAESQGSTRKGLRGHLGALRDGELTTGGLKVVGLAGAGLVAAAVLGGGPSGSRRGVVGRVFDVGASGAVIAGTANLVNLLDLRPGRALKASALLAVPLLAHPGGGGLASTVLGAGGVAAPGDLAERDMLGDAGANALGAVLGTAVVASAPRVVRLGWLATVVGLTLASERVSFTEMIERTEVLRRVDEWGRR